MISRTAANMAAFRALESAKPVRERLFEDAHAQRLLPAFQRLAIKAAAFTPVRRMLERYADWRAPGARVSGVARTRLIDDWLIGECEEGAEQVVFLGAGYDCRSLRLAALARTWVFELDRPELLARKAARLGAPPPHLTRVPIDFLQEAVKDRLLSAGFDPALRTVFVWEGVTNYLDDAAVGAVLECVAGFGASLIFTYVHADAVAGRFDAPGLATLLRDLRRIGEPWTFGLLPDKADTYLRERGLRRRADLGAGDYRALYPSLAPNAKGYEFYRVVLAESL